MGGRANKGGGRGAAGGGAGAAAALSGLRDEVLSPGDLAEAESALDGLLTRAAGVDRYVAEGEEADFRDAVSEAAKSIGARMDNLADALKKIRPALARDFERQARRWETLVQNADARPVVDRLNDALDIVAYARLPFARATKLLDKLKG